MTKKLSVDQIIDLAENTIAGPPESDPISAVYVSAYEELLKPFPSTPLLRFQLFNQLTGGFRPREFSIICGATGVGKTTLLANWSASLMQARVPHFVASVETGRTDFIKRVMSAISGKDWNTGDPVAVDQLKQFHAEHKQFFDANYLWLSRYENRFSVERLMSDIHWHVKNHGIKIAIIDNLNFFLEITRAADQLIEMDRVTHDLIIFCKRVDVHVVMVMHPRKTDGGRVESEFDIKGSSTAVQEAHNIFLFNRPDKQLLETGEVTPYDRELKIAKMRRRGRAVGAKIVLRSASGTRYDEWKLF